MSASKGTKDDEERREPNLGKALLEVLDTAPSGSKIRELKASKEEVREHPPRMHSDPVQEEEL